MFLQRFFNKGLAHSSYLLGAADTCAVIDPERHVDSYIQVARSMGMRITHVLETHLHADFISGHLELAEKTNAQIYVPKRAECQFDHIGVEEGYTFYLEQFKVQVLETPGHTPEHVSYVVTDTTRGTDPVCVFPGDTLFVGDVGRPDLFPGKSRQLALKLYESLYGRLLQLPDFCELYPAHGAGSLCGKAINAKAVSTIGYERCYNEMLQIKDREKFIRALTTNMPPPPPYFSRCSMSNRNGPTLLRNLSLPVGLNPTEFHERMQQPNTLILDVRHYGAFGGCHIPGSYNIDLEGKLATFAGWILPQHAEILLVTHNQSAVEEACMRLYRVGLDMIPAYLEAGIPAWAMAGYPLDDVRQLTPQKFCEMQTGGCEMAVIDVRMPHEYKKSHVPGALNIPVPELREYPGQLDPGMQVVLICSSGRRSSLGVSLLKRHGFKNIFNLAGGIAGYTVAGYKLVSIE